MTDDVAGQQSFSASLPYVNAGDPRHPYTMRIQVVMSQRPILTVPSRMRHVMNEPPYRSHQNRLGLRSPTTGILRRKCNGRDFLVPLL